MLPGHFLVAAGLLVLGFALRVYRLGVKDFWWDEAHSWALARLPLVEGVREGLAVLNDPLYIVVLHGWMRLSGQTAFALRYLSVLATLVTAAYVGRVALRAFGRRVAVIAMVLGAAAPIWIFYSQEVRQYALMPLIMLVMVESVLSIVQGRGGRWRPWVQLAVAEALSLYTHSFMMFAVFGVQVVIGGIWLQGFMRDKKRGWLVKWMLSQVGVLALCLPILPVYVNRGTGVLPPSDIGPVDLWNAVWLNWMGLPWEQAGQHSPLHTSAWVVMVGLGVGLVYAWTWPHFASQERMSPPSLSVLVGIILAGTASTIGFWLVNSKIHPRYLISMTPLIFLVLAWLIGHLSQMREYGWPGMALAVGLIGGLGVVSVLGLQRLYAGELIGYQHDTTWRVAAYLKEHLDENDGIITLDPYDFTLDFYDTGPAPLFRAGFAEGLHGPDDLLDFMAGKDEISVVAFYVERSDPQDITVFYLERYGTLQHIKRFEAYQILTYHLDGELEPRKVEFRESDQHWARLALEGVALAAGDSFTLALRWRTVDNLDSGVRYAVRIQVYDPLTDWLVAEGSGLLYDSMGRTTDQWEAGMIAEQYLILPVYPGAPPLDYRMELTLLDANTGMAFDVLDENNAPAGQQADIGIVRLASAPERWIYGYEPVIQVYPVDAAPLTGFSVDWPIAPPGGKVGMTLSWRIAPAQVEDEAVLRIVQDGQVIAEESGAPLQGRQVADRMPWLDHRVLTISDEAQSGPADIVLVLGGDSWVLGRIEIAGFERITDRPEIAVPFEAAFEGGPRLLGYDLAAPDPLTTDDAITLTLFWDTESDIADDYVVFTHILSEDGRLVGQHDGVPVQGARSTSGWIVGEYLIDEHVMPFNEDYSGPITIQIGLYDPDSFERLHTIDGGDAVPLPIEGLAVESPN